MWPDQRAGVVFNGQTIADLSIGGRPGEAAGETIGHGTR
jgi:hypothetical protein